MVMVLSWCITLNTMWQMIQLHECVPGVRFDRYYDLGRHAFGPKLGPWIVLPQQLIVQVGCDIVYMVTGGKCLKKFMEIACTNCTTVRQSYWICIFGGIHFFLSQLPNFNSVSGVSLAAAIMSLSYSTIAWVGSLSHGQMENVSYAYKKTSGADYIFRVFNALGQISFAYAGHAVVLEIQATIPSTPEKPSKVPMWKGALGAYFINAICYFPVAFIGYWAFGQDVDDNVLVALKRPSWLIASANLMVVVHVIGSYQVYAMPVFAMLEKTGGEKAELPARTCTQTHRSFYLSFTLFIGVTFPFFGDLLGFFGGFGFAPTSYFLPSIIWLKIKKPKIFSISWFVNWACIFVGVFIMLASTIGGSDAIKTFRNIGVKKKKCSSPPTGFSSSLRYEKAHDRSVQTSGRYNSPRKKREEESEEEEGLFEQEIAIRLEWENTERKRAKPWRLRYAGDLLSHPITSLTLNEGIKTLLVKEPCTNRGIFMTVSATGPGKGGGLLERPLIEKTTPGRDSEFDLRKSRKTAPPYRVLLYNDNYNKREYVVQVLMKVIPGMTLDIAVNIMQEAHHNGLSVVIICAQADAEEHCMQLRGNGLLSSIEPASSGC
ncbi:hypothetical protein F0562_034005 [Nyssa sinensis]|uniref:Adaptor protein ClpS core domain-containing protein n=1 Tax=Nyssa sinensis TaxID=561372 RepID=A0A5J5AHG8_9ASTE|nr:hypothetical protein F0562_034005 [Nyssa sinensis]